MMVVPHSPKLGYPASPGCPPSTTGLLSLEPAHPDALHLRVTFPTSAGSPTSPSASATLSLANCDLQRRPVLFKVLISRTLVQEQRCRAMPIYGRIQHGDKAQVKIAMKAPSTRLQERVRIQAVPDELPLELEVEEESPESRWKRVFGDGKASEAYTTSLVYAPDPDLRKATPNGKEPEETRQAELKSRVRKLLQNPEGKSGQPQIRSLSYSDEDEPDREIQIRKESKPRVSFKDTSSPVKAPGLSRIPTPIVQSRALPGKKTEEAKPLYPPRKSEVNPEVISPVESVSSLKEFTNGGLFESSTPANSCENLYEPAAIVDLSSDDALVEAAHQIQLLEERLAKQDETISDLEKVCADLQLVLDAEVEEKQELMRKNERVHIKYHEAKKRIVEHETVERIERLAVLEAASREDKLNENVSEVTTNQVLQLCQEQQAVREEFERQIRGTAKGAEDEVDGRDALIMKYLKERELSSKAPVQDDGGLYYQTIKVALFALFLFALAILGIFIGKDPHAFLDYVFMRDLHY